MTLLELAHPNKLPLVKENQFFVSKNFTKLGRTNQMVIKNYKPIGIGLSITSG